MAGCGKCQVVLADGHKARCGDRVYNYYDGWYGVLGCIDRIEREDDPWVHLTRDDGRYQLLNGERMCLRRPAWAERCEGSIRS